MPKRSTKKIIGIGACTLVGILLASFLAPKGAPRSYLQAAAVLVGVIASTLLLGWARPRSHESKAANIILILAAIVYQITLFVLLGLKLGFVANVYKWNLTSIFQVFLPPALTIILAEILRGQLVIKGSGSKFAVYYTACIMLLIQTAIALPAYLPFSARNLFEITAITIFPAILTNTLLTFIAYTHDYRTNIAYRLIMELPIYLLPIRPDISTYLSSLFLIIFTSVLVISYISYGKWYGHINKVATLTKKRLKRLPKDQHQKFSRYAKRFGLSFGVILAFAYVALMSGLFKYNFLAIGSGSMEPSIYRGDLILVKKTNHYDKIKAGDVLVYRRKNIIVVHRVSEIETDGQTYRFHTKGDANNTEDIWQVNQSDVVGVAKGKLATLGYPTLWLHDIFSNEQN